MTTPSAPVRRRHVFYIPGHDPAGGRRYREIYRAEAAKQAAVSGYEIEIDGVPAKGENYAWTARSIIDGQRTEAMVEFLMWNDLVKRSLSKSLLSSYGLMLRTLWIYLRSGAFLAIWRARPVMLFTTVYPFAIYLGAPLLGLLVGALLAWIGGMIVPLPGWTWAVSGAIGIAVMLRLFRRYDQKYFITYLMLAYAYTSANRGGIPPGLDTRSDAFAERVAEALADANIDEVLIVGHSAGAGIGIRICSKLLQEGRVPEGKLALLGIGSVSQMISFLPHAQWMRTDMRRLAACDHLAWVEVTAPSDGMCFAMADPVATTGVDVTPDQKRWPLVISAAFHHSLSEAYRADPDYTQFRRHFQYIYHFDQPQDYDYFQITAGPLRLADRYHGRAHSPSRVTRAVGPYRDY